MAFGGGGLGANDGEEGRVTACGRMISVTVGTVKPEAACSGAAGNVGTWAVAEPAMLGHQHGAVEPAPWCIDDGMAS